MLRFNPWCSLAALLSALRWRLRARCKCLAVGDSLPEEVSSTCAGGATRNPGRLLLTCPEPLALILAGPRARSLGGSPFVDILGVCFVLISRNWFKYSVVILGFVFGLAMQIRSNK